MTASGRRELELQLRRERLLTRSAELRGTLAAQWGVLRQPPWAIEARAGLDWMKAHPQMLAGALVALVVLRPRRVLRWGGQALAAWQLWRRLRPLWIAWVGGRR
jgi:hypothetical protein